MTFSSVESFVFLAFRPAASGLTRRSRDVGWWPPRSR
jgi:hypothetical protein